MCRQFHAAYGTSIAVLRPCSIIDTRLRLSKYDAELKSGSWGTGLVYRHDLAEAWRPAIEKDDLGFQVLHMAVAAEADLYCNTREAGDVLDLEFKGYLDQFRKIRRSERKPNAMSCHLITSPSTRDIYKSRIQS